MLSIANCGSHINVVKGGMPTKNPVITLVLTDDLLKRVDDYRYENRIPTRAEAVRKLLEKGLKGMKEKEKTLPEKK
jgi:metal-responsive CopG/Arc/MetJ family transcriptional regulator